MPAVLLGRSRPKGGACRIDTCCCLLSLCMAWRGLLVYLFVPSAGVQLLLDGVLDYLPCPTEVKNEVRGLQPAQHHDFHYSC